MHQGFLLAMTAIAIGLFKVATRAIASRALLCLLACRFIFHFPAFFDFASFEDFSIQIRLTHVSTKRNLHSHHVTSPLTHQQEVSCYGNFFLFLRILCGIFIASFR
jgi:hypothetical protein